jgi:hypothetical protein
LAQNVAAQRKAGIRPVRSGIPLPVPFASSTFASAETLWIPGGSLISYAALHNREKNQFVVKITSTSDDTQSNRFAYSPDCGAIKAKMRLNDEARASFVMQEVHPQPTHHDAA